MLSMKFRNYIICLTCALPIHAQVIPAFLEQWGNGLTMIMLFIVIQSYLL